MSDNFREHFADEMQRAMDGRAHAITIISEEHRLTHDGMVFAIGASELDVPDGQSRKWLFRTGTIPVHFKRLTIGASEGPVVITLSENPTLSDEGTLGTTPVNLNRMSSTTPLMEYRVDVVDTAPGDPVLGSLYVPQQGNQGVTGETGAIEEIILASNTDYLFTLTNDPAGAGTADIYINIVFYELSYEIP